MIGDIVVTIGGTTTTGVSHVGLVPLLSDGPADAREALLLPLETCEVVWEGPRREVENG